MKHITLQTANGSVHTPPYDSHVNFPVFPDGEPTANTTVRHQSLSSLRGRIKVGLLFLLLIILHAPAWGETAHWRLSGGDGFYSLPETAGNTQNYITLKPSKDPIPNGNLFGGGWSFRTYELYTSDLITITTTEAWQLSEIKVSCCAPSNPGFKIEFYDDEGGDKLEETARSITPSTTLEGSYTISNIPEGAHYAKIYDSNGDWQHYLYDIQVTTTAAPVVTKYTASFAAGDASGNAPASIARAEGKKYTLPEPTGLTYTGHLFTGWKSSADNNIYAAGQQMTMGTAAVTYTAQWKAGYIAEWGEKQSIEPIHSFGTTSNKVTTIAYNGEEHDNLKFAENVNGWGKSGVSAYKPKGNPTYLDIELSNDVFSTMVISEIVYSIYLGGPKLYITYASTQHFDASAALGSAVELTNGNAQNENQKFYTLSNIPSRARSARITTQNNAQGETYLYYLKVTIAERVAPTERYTVSFDTQGGSSVADVQEDSPESGIILPAAPTKSGNLFAGWYTAATGGTLVGFGGTKYYPTEDCTLHAHWDAELYAKSIDFMQKDTQAVAVATVLSRNNYTMSILDNNVSWDNQKEAYSGDDCGLKTEYNDREFSFWVRGGSEVTITLGTWQGNKGGNGTAELQANGAKLADLAAKTANGPYTTTEATKFVIKIVDPYWSLIQKINIVTTYTVTYAAGDHGSGTMTDPNSPYNAGSDVTILPNGFTPAAGYEFDGYKDQDGTTRAADSQITSIAKDYTLTAQWKLKKYTIKFNNYDNSELQSKEVEHGATPAYTGATPTKPQDAQYTYTHNGWTPDIVAATQDATYTATFSNTTRQYAISATVKSGEEDYGSINPTSFPTTPVDYGTAITIDNTNRTITIGGQTITATAKDATAEYTYAFNGWTVSPEGSTITDVTTATASFTCTKNQYTINALSLSNCSVTGTAWPTGQKEYGSSFSTTISADKGYALPETITVLGAEYTWNANSGALSITSVTGDVSVTITAEKSQIEPTVTWTDVPATVYPGGKYAFTVTTNSDATLEASQLTATGTASLDKSLSEKTMTVAFTMAADASAAPVFTWAIPEGTTTSAVEAVKNDIPLGSCSSSSSGTVTEHQLPVPNETSPKRDGKQPLYAWEVAGVGVLAREFGTSSTTVSSITTPYGGSSYKISTQDAQWMIQSQLNNVTKIRLYVICYKTNTSLAHFYQSSSFFENPTSEIEKTVTTTFSNGQTTFTSSEEGYIDITLSQPLNSGDFCMIEFSDVVYYISAGLFTGEGGGGADQTPNLIWSNSLADGATVEKTTTDGNFTYTASSDNCAGSVSYASSETSVATVNSTTGEVTIVGAGTTTITATIAEHGCFTEKSITYTLNVTATTHAVTLQIADGQSEWGTIDPTSISAVDDGTSISADGATLTIGNQDIAATPTTATAEYTYAFSNWSWTPEGSTITAATTATASFTRTPKQYALTWNFGDGGSTSSTTYTPAGQVDFGATINYPEANTMSRAGYTFTGWDKSDPTMPAENLTITAQWTVIKVTGVSLNKTTTSISAGSSEPLTATVAPDNATNKTVTWSITEDNADGKITVSSLGVVSVADDATDGATATVTVTTTDGGFTASCTVTVVPAHDYAISANFMELMGKYGSSGQYSTGVKDELNSHNYTVSNVSDWYWDYQPGSNDGGLGVDDEHTITFWVKANQYVSIKAGSLEGQRNGVAVVTLYNESDSKIDTIHVNAGNYREYTTSQITKFVLTIPKTVVSNQHWNRIHHIMITSIPHTISFNAGEGGSGTMADMKVPEDSTYTLPICGFTPPPSDKVGYMYIFNGWKLQGGDDNTYDPGAKLTMGTTDLTYVAQWEELDPPILPRVTNLTATGDAGNPAKVNLSWMIPGYVDLSTATAPYVATGDGSDANPEFTLQDDGSSLDISCKLLNCGNSGVGFPISSGVVESVVDSMSFEYKVTFLNAGCWMWGGAGYGNNHFNWQDNGNNNYGGKLRGNKTEWTSASCSMNYSYWEGSKHSEEDNQIAILINANANYDDPQIFSVRNVRYYVKNTVDISNVKILRKKGSAPTGRDDAGATVVFKPGIGFSLTDNLTEGYGTYYYTAFTYTDTTITYDRQDSAVVIYEYKAPVVSTNTFTNNNGAGDNKWSTTTNWSLREVPTIDQDVVIAANCSIPDTTAAVANRVVIRENVKLIISSQASLVVAGAIQSGENYTCELSATTADQILIQSSEESIGALILDNSKEETNATVNMVSKSYKVGNKSYWQYVGIPLAETTMNESFGTATTWLFDETYASDNGWIRKSGNDKLYAFNGYGLSGDNKGTTFQFKGTLTKTGEKVFTLTNTYTAQGGINMLANSWTAPIDLTKMTTDNFGEGLYATIYIYNTGRNDERVGSKYGDKPGQWLSIPIEGIKTDAYDGLKVIPAMQSFDVWFTDEAYEAKSPLESTVTIDYDLMVRGIDTEKNNINEPLRAPARRSASQAIDPKDVASMRIAVADSKTKTTIYLLEHEGFSDDYDNGWDASYRKCDGRSAMLYANSDLGKMAFLAKQDIEGTTLGFAPGTENMYTFTFFYDGADNYYLNDVKLQQSTLISSDNEYSFTTTGTETNRFYISRTPLQQNTPTNTFDVKVDDQAKKIIYNEHFFIIHRGNLFDGQGKLVK